MENLRNRRYKFNNLRNSIISLDDTTSSVSRVGDLNSNFGSFSGLGGSDLQTAASGHGGYGCCETGVDFATLLALLAGMPH